MSSSLSGRTVLVTGATSGIGYQTARLLAEHGATVLMHGRTTGEAHTAVDRLATQSGMPAEQLCAYGADFARLEEVERLAARVTASHPHLDVLVNNAGMAAPERHTVTADGNEIAFQVNFLAHYLLTHLLEPALTSDPGGRVVNVSSTLHRTGSIQWNDPNRTRRYSRLAAYAQSQLALTVFAADPRVTAVSVHPGICDTNLLPLYAHEGTAPADGAAHVVRLCDPAVEIVNGAYYDRDQRVAPAPAATEERTIKRLNKLADLLVGHTA
ncbi:MULTISPECIES: SDR family NAD(P)-dependent oxidoreductase [Streptomyces]|uniref:SDR family NAD(P)-dependent oxidoreductase n=1 Tax=Streptomyces TaxID=1883 RepID=UPI001E5F677B|nr:MULTISPECIES: SDR family NAD(P)-dependent oxidoreductase [Streptomyces]UFQ19968.1 SDR family NAD(P)-dependent oxidoreductase [Streptomyces huasconensis]WCL89589.1 SDR family NAD(P)-dependent oxidoreductase [Streptomyces sp. JCM 35825]